MRSNAIKQRVMGLLCVILTLLLLMASGMPAFATPAAPLQVEVGFETGAKDDALPLEEPPDSQEQGLQGGAVPNAEAGSQEIDSEGPQSPEGAAEDGQPADYGEETPADQAEGTAPATEAPEIAGSQEPIAVSARIDILKNGQPVAVNPLQDAGDTKITYRILVESAQSVEGQASAIPPGQVYIRDKIRVPEGAALRSVGNLKVTGFRWEDGGEWALTGHEADHPPITPGDVTFDAYGRTLTITNSGAMAAARRYYVAFDVSYSHVVYGSLLKNALGNEVVSYAPLQITLAKKDAWGQPLPGAEFTLYYGNESGTAPDYGKIAAITNEAGVSYPGGVVTTGSAGRNILHFTLPPEEILAQDSWTLFLKETKIPQGYAAAQEVLVKYTVRKSSDGTRLYLNSGEETGNKTGCITTCITNTKEGRPTAELRIGKEYAPPWPEDYSPTAAEKAAAYDFYFRLERQEEAGQWKSVDSGIAVHVTWQEEGKLFAGSRSLQGLPPGTYRISEVIPPKAPYHFLGWKTAQGFVAGTEGEALVLHLTAKATETVQVTGVNSARPLTPETPPAPPETPPAPPETPPAPPETPPTLPDPPPPLGPMPPPENPPLVELPETPLPLDPTTPPQGQDTPKTGDETHRLPWVVVSVFAMVGMVGVVAVEIRSRKHRK